MLHVIIKYPGVVTKLYFIKVTKMSMEFWGGTEVKYDIQTEDGAYVGSLKKIDFDDWRMLNPNKNIILDDFKLSKIGG